MASFKRDGNVWRVQLHVHGVRASATFPTKNGAEAWAKTREQEIRESPVLRRRPPLRSTQAASFRRMTELLDQEDIVRRASANAAVAGVYFLIKGNQIVYVGQSRNVHARVAVHVASKEFDGFHVIPCPAQELLARMFHKLTLRSKQGRNSSLFCGRKSVDQNYPNRMQNEEVAIGL